MSSKLQSQAILAALKSKLKCPIRYFCQVTHIGMQEGSPFQIPIIFCLGEHSMFLLDDQMQGVLGEVYYAHIILVVEQDSTAKGQVDVMRIEINDDRPAGIPAKITVISSEKSILLKHLRCYWETDYMWRVSKYAVLRVDKENIDLRKYKTKKNNNLDKEKYNYCSTMSNKDTQKGYTYFIPNFMKKEKLVGEFTAKIGECNYFLKVQIEDPLQIEYIKDDLRSKAETIAENLARDDLKHKFDSDSFAREDKYCFVKNAPYLKKMNLVIDWAMWRGWSVVLKSDNMFYSVIILRRKFIPPLVDTGQDFIFLAKGGPESFKVSSEPADTIYTLSITSQIYKEILVKRCNALIMDEETADFFRVQLQIEPEDKALAYLFILSIAKIIGHDQKQGELQKLIDEIRKRNDFNSNNQNLDPCEVIDKFVAVYTGSSPIGIIKWKEKVCRYLAFAVDGGLYQSKFTLDEVIKCAKDGSLRDISQLSTLKRCIKLLLHIRKLDEVNSEKSQSQNNSEDLYEPISNLLKDCKNRRYDSKRWTFNEKVMTTLIETSYLQRELDISGDVNVYPSLLIFLLQSPFSGIELKSAICRVTVVIDDSGDFNVFKQLIPYFLKVFKDKNYKLATQAAISLINLTHSNRENKQTIFKERKVIISKLNCKDQKLLSYTVLILNNLATESSRRKVIASEIREPLCNIIKGRIIDIDILSIEVLSKVFLTLITITSKDHTSAESMASDLELIKASIFHLERFDEEIPNLCWFFEIITDKSPLKRNILGENLIPPLITKLKADLSQEQNKNILMLIKAMLQTNENLSLARTLGLNDYLKNLLMSQEVNNDQTCIKIAKFILRIDRQ